jgi:hypothetical protein
VSSKEKPLSNSSFGVDGGPPDSWFVMSIRLGWGNEGPQRDIKDGKKDPSAGSDGNLRSSPQPIGHLPLSEMMACISAESSNCPLAQLFSCKDSEAHGQLPRNVPLHRCYSLEMLSKLILTEWDTLRLT